MRTSEEGLAHCPMCAGPVTSDLGLRDFSTWLNDLLPGRVGASDLDCVIEQHSTGRMLVLEFKPSRYVPKGQRILFDALVARDVDVYVVVEDRDKKISLGRVPETHDADITWRTVTLLELRAFVRYWWEGE